jgi:hypothetical protein
LQPRYRGVLLEDNAKPFGRSGKCQRRLDRLRMSVAGRKEAAGPFLTLAWKEFRDLARVDQI